MARAVSSNWPDLSDEELLKLRLSDLPLKLEGTVVETRIDQLKRELEGRGLNFPLHFYLSDEWFTPDGQASMAVPFYLAHPRLERLEKAQMLAVEGGEHEWCMRILRHEAGHVIDNAYKLRLRRQRRQLFGSPTQEYPGVLRAAAVLQELRAASRPVVRAEPSRRRLRRNLRGVADAGIQLEDPLRGLAGDQEARIHGRADALAGRQEAAARPGRGGRSAAPPESHAALSLPQEARPLRRRPPDVLRSRLAQAVLGCAGARRRT